VTESDRLYFISVLGRNAMRRGNRFAYFRDVVVTHYKPMGWLR
jgi:hypothetical protein